MIGVSVKGGTGAGHKLRRDPNIKRCPSCGGFLSNVRAERGATVCLRCETDPEYRKPTP